jgi:hypothetical protein
MKMISIISRFYILVSVLLLFVGCSLEKCKREILSDHNEYGGKTIRATCSDDESYKNGSKNSDIYYSGSGKIMMSVVYFTDEFKEKRGCIKLIIYCDENELLKKTEWIYTEKHALKEGYNKSVDLPGKDEKLKIIEKYMNDKLVDRKVLP